MKSIAEPILRSLLQGAPLNEADHCGDPPLLLAAGNGKQHLSMGQKEQKDARMMHGKESKTRFHKSFWFGLPLWFFPLLPATVSSTLLL